MTRRPVLPGASELFRRTDTASVDPRGHRAAQPEHHDQLAGAARRARPDATDEAGGGMPLTLVPGGAAAGRPVARTGPGRRPRPCSRTSPTRGRPARSRADRTKHDEKITVYISADELLALETARLTLRGQHGVAADRGRIVREAIAVLLADLDERGDDSVLVRRLRGQ